MSATNTSQSHGTANLALYFPVQLTRDVVITKLWWQNGSAVAGNVDCGIYDAEGNRLVSTGSTAQTGTNAVQSVDITDTLILSGLIYLAIAASSASATFWTIGSAALAPVYGWSVYQQSNAMPLPATASYATTKTTSVRKPKFGALVAPRTVI